MAKLKIECNMVRDNSFFTLATNKVFGSIKVSFLMAKEKEEEPKELEKTSFIRENFIMIINMVRELNYALKIKKKMEKKFLQKFGNIKENLYKAIDRMIKLFTHANIILIRDHIETTSNVGKD